MGLTTAAWIAYLAPLAGFLLIALAGHRLPASGAGWVACLALLASFAASLATLSGWNAPTTVSSPRHGPG